MGITIRIYEILERKEESYPYIFGSLFRQFIFFESENDRLEDDLGRIEEEGCEYDIYIISIAASLKRTILKNIY